MAAGDAVAADVPGIYDLVVNGKGYMFLEKAEEGTKARYGYTKTFVERQNVSGNYGDNEEDFYLTVTQKDWSLGEGQRYFRSNDPDSSRKYYMGSVDIRTPGQFNSIPLFDYSAGTTYVSGCPTGSASTSGIFAICTSTNLFEITNRSASTDKGAHGLGAAPEKYGMCTDGRSVFLTTQAAGTVGVRRWSGSAFSTFSATDATSIEFLNNTLYGIRASDGTLKSYSTAGVATTVYTWQDAIGGASTWIPIKLKAFGGKLLILIQEPGGASLWQYDGTGVSILARFPGNFSAYDMEVVQGAVFVSGLELSGWDGSTSYNWAIPSILFYASGTIGTVWRPNNDGTSIISRSISNVRNTKYAPSLASLNGGLAFSVYNSWASSGTVPDGIRLYNPETGSVHVILKPTNGTDNGGGVLVSAKDSLIFCPIASSYHVGPLSNLQTGSGANVLYTSLYDFDSSQNKYFKSISIDFDGSSSTVSVAYQLNSLDSSWTSLGTTTNGAELALGLNGRSIAFRITLAADTTNIQSVKRIRVRAAPILNSFRKGQYILDLAGTDAKGDPQLRNGRFHPLSGLAQAQNLVTATTATTPFSITDRFGTFTGIIEPAGFEIVEIAPEEYIGIVPVRQV